MVKQRFIAGAVCPECGVMDRIVVVVEAQESSRRCVSCGFSDTTKLAAGPVPKTRLTRKTPPPVGTTPGSPERDRSATTNVRIIDGDE